MSNKLQTHINASQIRAARALVNWSQEDLAEASGLSLATIRKIEAGHISPRGSTMSSISSSLENMYVEFTPSSGVRLKDNNISTIEGNDAYLQLLDHVYHTMKDKGGEVLFLYFDTNANTEDERNAEIRLRHANINWRFLLEEGNTNIYYPLDEFRLLPKQYFKRNLQLIFANQVAMGCNINKETNTTTKITIIESPILAESNRNLFNFMWDNCRNPAFSTAQKAYA